MTKETELLNELFDTVPHWRGHKIRYCDMCETYTIDCAACGGGCSRQCEVCKNDQSDFSKLKKSHYQFMSDAEKETLFKAKVLDRLILFCLESGVEPIDFHLMRKLGKLSEHDEQVFSKELEGSEEYNPEFSDQWHKDHNVKD